MKKLFLLAIHFVVLIFKLLKPGDLKAVNGNSPSWLRFIGHMKDSLWPMDLFCCESIILFAAWDKNFPATR